MVLSHSGGEGLLVALRRHAIGLLGPDLPPFDVADPLAVAAVIPDMPFVRPVRFELIGRGDELLLVLLLRLYFGLHEFLELTHLFLLLLALLPLIEKLLHPQARVLILILFVQHFLGTGARR